MTEWEKKIFKEIVEIKSREDKIYAGNVLAIVKKEIEKAISEVKCKLNYYYPEGIGKDN